MYKEPECWAHKDAQYMLTTTGIIILTAAFPKMYFNIPLIPSFGEYC